MLLHRKMLTKMTELFTFFLNFVRKKHNLYNNPFTWGKDPAPLLPDLLRRLYPHSDQPRPVLLLKELNICSSPSKIKNIHLTMYHPADIALRLRIRQFRAAMNRMVKREMWFSNHSKLSEKNR
jgi:hypothetical protein